MNIQSEPLSLFGKVIRWGITVLLILFLWISGLYHLANLEYKYHDDPLFQDLGLTWFGTGALTLIVFGGWIVLSFGSWAHRHRKWTNYLQEVAKIEKENYVLKALLNGKEIRRKRGQT